MILPKEWVRYCFLSADPLRSKEEDAEMWTLRKALEDAGVNCGDLPVPRDEASCSEWEIYYLKKEVLG